MSAPYRSEEEMSRVRARIVEIARGDPDLSNAVIAKHVGVQSHTVAEILDAAGVRPIRRRSS